MDDFISRAAAMSMPLANGQYDHEHSNEHFIFGLETYKEWLEQIPAADVRPVVRGEWMMIVDSIFNGERFVEWCCSECGYVRNRGWRHTNDGKTPDAKFCENCGADMRPEGGADG